jgi:dipeptidyl aminopeptidase/acylaminoacyl peptidase
MTYRFTAGAALAPLLLALVSSVLAAPASAQAVTPTGAPTREERGNLVLDGVPPHSPAMAEAVDRWMAGRGAGFRDFLPDGSILVGTRFGEAEQLHRVAAPLGAREQLTFSPEPVGGALVPRGAAAPGFVFLSDRGGNENAQLTWFSLADRSQRLLTDGRSRHGSPVWSRDGQRIAFHGNGRDAASQDVWIADVAAGGAPRLRVTAQGRSWSPLDWSPDDARLLLLDYTSVTEARLFIVDVATAALTPVPIAPPGTDPAKAEGLRTGIGGARFSLDGTGVWVIADAGGEFRQMLYVDLATGRSRSVSPDIPWDIEEFDLSPDGRFLAMVANVDGFSRLRLLDLGAATEVPVRGLPEGLIGGLSFDRSGGRLGMTIESAQSPRDAWTWEIATGTATRWTRSEVGPVDPARFVPAQLVRYPTWDREGGRPRQIPAFVYRPATPGPHPVVIDIHGGPEGQSRPGFSAWTQFLVNELGYVVIAPNVRGSTGYGRRYTELDNGMLRQDSVRDIGSLLVWIAAQRDLDAGRVVVTGGSYGGYMVLASLVNYGDRLRGGIDVVGISNFVTFLRNTSAYRRDLRRAEYGDERDPRMRAFLERISPLTNAGMIRKPLLVVQGLNDPRVPASESEQLVEKVRAARGEVWYLAAKDEGHGFRKKGNRDFYLKTAATFLEQLRK